MPDPIQDLLRERAEAVEASLERLLSREVDEAHSALALLGAAIRHGTLGGGKRLRPFLTISAAEACGGGADPLPAACAVEMVHAYSLVHDDLPAMDDAATRRGRPSVHAAYGEDVGVLAGDGLLTDAFGVIADAAYAPPVAIRLVRLLAAGAGSSGMVGGQMMDLHPQALDESEVVAIQGRKTGALIEAACLMGGVVGGADEAELEALSAYARALGLAFQVQDDVLDATADEATLGKPAGQDAEAGKATFVALLGLDGARRRVAALTDEAVGAAQRLPSPEVLVALARFLAGRAL
ncbi:polyprenyl synthetase family protein [Parvularcula dongshanensis]|uniref:Geranylgeranyl pyrophosphate synthase n=1 Tax=Parvularcula dongshanensis TaxID=1173995 RepID=A0A840I0A0_9PROT|nr:farnesyl diphosphate synthase [Parvularcula dongshanensis]MBB4657598.1 geranylgeranyl pyrophosphate synthase [Parvularcula dongshanensis]